MLEINSGTNSMYLTKGDTAIINITLAGDTSGYSSLHFYIRNANSLDDVKVHLSSDGTGETSKGTISGSSNHWVIRISAAATEELKRQKYVYDFKLKGDSNVTTFIGGGKTKTEFWVT